jgi:hypothetical protein
MEDNMKDRPYPYIPKNPKKETKFSKKWGITAIELAAEEGVTPDAIQMRVMKFGTPFQRKKLPTVCEVLTGKTTIELGHEIGVTPISITKRLQEYGDPYYTAPIAGPSATRGTHRAEKHWSETKLAGVKPGAKYGWLSPRHPEYHTWRYKYIQQHCPTAKDTINTEDK